jgi:hypothetical protein
MTHLGRQLRAAAFGITIFGIVAFALTWWLATDGTTPALEVFAAARVPLMWCVVIVGAGFLMFLISAMVSGEDQAGR